MSRKLIGCAAVVLILASVGAFAAEKRSSSVPYLVSSNGPGALDLTVTGGWGWWGWGVNAGAEYTVSQFELGPVPLSWGVTAQGSLGFDSAGIGIAAAGLATLNLGFDFGKNLRFEGFFGLGPGLVLEAWSGGGSGLGIAQLAGATWWFSNSIGLTGEEGYVDAFGWGGWWFAGLGVTLKL
ncbi:MAG TPA: hypothetical protein VFI08_03750 [Spirochaetia bacterium]|nr:hypothetical protein [Spirochaetia bacterium]